MTETHEHSDPSTRPVKYSVTWWDARNHLGQCKAHRKNGDRCRRPHDPGATVCGHHGARAPAVRRRARQRLEEATDRMARELLKVATDHDVTDAVKLRAITEALDRGNVTSKTEIEISAKPIDQIFDGFRKLEGGSREAFRRGIADESASDSYQHTPALAVGEDFDVYAPLRNQQGGVHTVTPDGDVWPPAPHTATGTDDQDDALNPFVTSGPPSDATMSRTDAYAAQADYQRRIAAQRQADAAATRETYRQDRADRFGLPRGSQ